MPPTASSDTSRHWSRRASLQALTLSALWVLTACQPNRRMNPLSTGATVLALGDSITYGTGAPSGHDWPQLLSARTGWHIINAGIPGDTTQGARERVAALLTEHQPALVIIELGGNDFLRRRPPDRVKEDLRDIVRQAKASGAQVLLVAVPELSLLAAFASRLSDAPLYQALADEEGVGLLAEALSEVLSQPTLKTDQIHPNAAGYQQFADQLYRYLQKVGLLQT